VMNIGKLADAEADERFGQPIELNTLVLDG